MARYFNTEGRCNTDEHYMVRLDDRLAKIKKLFIDRGKYFVINRGRQYGKTTTLMALAEYLKDEYIVIAMDFQMMSTADFADEQTFAGKFIRQMKKIFFRKKELMRGMEEDVFQEFISLGEKDSISLDILFEGMSRICETAKKPVVMIIDEVDSGSNNQVFLDFLAQLRGYYLDRERHPIFHSVILAGVYDIKNLKLKVRPDEEHRYNSPWNISARFNLDMSFPAVQIAAMLEEYEADKHTGMKVQSIAEEIYKYTSGYPYLVSAVCKYLDEEVAEKEGFGDIAAVWTKEGIAEAVKILLYENTPLFDSMVKQLDLYKDMRNMIEEIIYQGRQIPFSPAEKAVNLGLMFGFLKEENGHVVIANRIFEMYLLNMFMAEEALEGMREGQMLL